MAQLQLLTHDESGTSPAEECGSCEPMDNVAVNDQTMSYEAAAEAAIAFYPREMTEAEKDRCREEHRLLYGHPGQFVAYVDDYFERDGVSRMRRIVLGSSEDPVVVAKIAASFHNPDLVAQSYFESPDDGPEPIIPD